MSARTLDSLIAAGELTADEARTALGGNKKRSKYGAVRCELDGYSFDSKQEMARYSELALRQLAGEIRGLVVHPVYPLVVQGIRIAAYEPDFVYTDCRTGDERVEDVKGGKATITAVFRLKKKLFEVCYPLLKVEIV
jgi:Protein of unknown function (DUF1064)